MVAYLLRILLCPFQYDNITCWSTLWVTLLGANERGQKSERGGEFVLDVH